MNNGGHRRGSESCVHVRVTSWISTSCLHEDQLLGEGTDTWEVQISSRRLRAWDTWARANTQQEAGLTQWPTGVPGRGQGATSGGGGLVMRLGLGFWDYENFWVAFIPWYNNIRDWERRYKILALYSSLYIIKNVSWVSLTSNMGLN